MSSGTSAVYNSVKSMYDETQKFPTKHPCSGCDVELAVPPEAFRWTCGLDPTHSTSRSKKLCSAVPPCPGVRPDDLPNPRISCAACHAVTEVPTTNLRKAIAACGREIFRLKNDVVSNAQKEYTKFTSRPTEFNCSHCNSKLTVPTGPWTCQRCSEENGADDLTCKSETCFQPRRDQLVICAVCQKSTAIPSSNFLNSIQKEFADVKRESWGALYFIKGEKYITCSRCKAIILADPDSGVAPKMNSAGLPVLKCDSCGHDQVLPRDGDEVNSAAATASASAAAASTATSAPTISTTTSVPAAAAAATTSAVAVADSASLSSVDISAPIETQ